MKTSPPVHFTAPEVLNASEAVSVNLIGIGGTGSHLLGALVRTNDALRALGHPGLFVQAFDPKNVSEASRSRQAFAHAEVGLNKAIAMIHRVNRNAGTDWKAIPSTFQDAPPEKQTATISISSVDLIGDRYQIANLLSKRAKNHYYSRDLPRYWLDCGNNINTGQVLLSTVGKIKQPKSKKYKPIAQLPFVTQEFHDLLKEAEKTEQNVPSCSAAQSLAGQDLFINSFIAQTCGKILWNLFRTAMITNRGAWVNLETMTMTPIIVE